MNTIRRLWAAKLIQGITNTKQTAPSAKLSNKKCHASPRILTKFLPKPEIPNITDVEASSAKRLHPRSILPQIVKQRAKETIFFPVPFLGRVSVPVLLGIFQHTLFSYWPVSKCALSTGTCKPTPSPRFRTIDSGALECWFEIGRNRGVEDLRRL